ncbi:hypothetical protein ABG088_09110, partial [Hydrogenibacillus schlegelii]
MPSDRRRRGCPPRRASAAPGRGGACPPSGGAGGPRWRPALGGGGAPAGAGDGRALGLLIRLAVVAGGEREAVRTAVRLLRVRDAQAAERVA